MLIINQITIIKKLKATKITKNVSSPNMKYNKLSRTIMRLSANLVFFYEVWGNPG